MKRIILGLFLYVFLFLGVSFANLSVSPLKYEFDIDKGDSMTATIKLRNQSDQPLTIYTSKEDFIAADDKGTPKFVKPGDEGYIQQYGLSSWIKLEQDRINIGPNQTIEVKFTVNVPQDAEPGGKYGAIFFSPGAESGQLAVVARLGVLILINVPGQIKVAGEFGDLAVGKIQGENFVAQEHIQELPVHFPVNFVNQGNVHLKPKGQILILDENGQQLEKIGRETLVSDLGVRLGEKLVDYIPVNEANGNVLPGSDRTFDAIWRGFGYQVLNADGSRAVKFKTLQEYYDEKAAEQKKYLQFWETIQEEEVKKKFTAQFALYYEGPEGKVDEYNGTKDFFVTYKQSVVGINRWVVGGAGVLVIIIILLFVMKGRNSEAKIRQKIMDEMQKNKK